MRSLCCQCGIPMESNLSNMCANCIRNEIDITEGIPKQITANFCKNCDRWLQPPNTWTVAAFESKELMALLLRKLKVNLSGIAVRPYKKLFTFTTLGLKPRSFS